ncbi:ATP-grasp domain-containing protein [Streptomyces sp. NPDC059175]|uniref:preATP grasp domain-containing protein n=1 Tax=Streptomyces sp. NPDC059175 TaxID=3346757 RepID=UPI00369A02BB
MNRPGFNERLKRALTGDRSAPLVFLGNFEVEEQWARGESGLPRVTSRVNTAVVNRMDEFALLLGAADDHVVLKTEPDPAYLRYLTDLGVELPTVHVIGEQDPGNTVTEDALADGRLLGVLADLGAAGALMLPHGVSGAEEELSEKTGLALAAPPAALCKSVNSKVYSRRVADALGLRQPRGWACSTLAEFAAAVDAATEILAAGAVVLVKEAFGVSGKGISTIESPDRLRRLHRMVVSRAERAGTDRVAFVIEERVAKRVDLNYQFTVSREREVHIDFVKEALTRNGVHMGHRFPPDLSPAQVDEIHTTARLLGEQLSADGYAGVVGVDAMLDPSGGVYPVIEINARNNMSTYQVRLQEQLMRDGQFALARHYPLTLHEPLAYQTAARLLDDVLLTSPGGAGLVINNFATVNAGRGAEGPFPGRLYGMLIGDSPEELTALDTAVTDVLAAGLGRESGDR